MRNGVGWKQYLARLQGSAIELDLRSYEAPLSEINRLEPDVQTLSNDALTERARRLRQEAASGTSGSVAAGADAGLDGVRSRMFALVREASRRTLDQRPFDEQVVAGLALDRGRIVEMQTGEGKTLAAVMPAALNALIGYGLHVLTFNDYLARRDAEWMGPIYRMVGVTVGFVQEGMSTEERRRAYLSDVTYATAKEAGFDYLRDLLATDARQLVHRPFHFALVDEADSLLVDEARVPLVIAGSIDGGRSRADHLAALCAALTPGIDFDMDEYARDVELTDAGIEKLERELGCGSLHSNANYRLLTEINCALHARALLRRDADYIVRGGRVEIIDEFTGRVVPDRHWPDGLQAAVEAKEHLDRRPDGRILGSITLQHFIGGYRRLCGMTGTAQDAAEELRELYGLNTVVIPTHRPMIRVDHPDVLFASREAKERAVIEEIRRVHASGRPVLVGTLTVEESERLAGRLRSAGVRCAVLNAKHDAAEARIVARAGALGAVTISTNMAGRGTDIRLGAARPAGATIQRDPDLHSGTEHGAAHDRLAALGGLYVIGTNRHESRRVDLQLRGRAGRQGDPGDTRFFVSLEDDLLVRYNIRSLLPRGFVAPDSREPIDNPIVRREVARAQRIIEGQNFQIRKTLWRYASVVEQQRQQIMGRRQALLIGRDVPDVWQRASEQRAALVSAVGEDAVRHAELAVTLFEMDRAWRDHLAWCADLREGIHLVSLGAGDPLTHFAREIIGAFERLEGAVDEAALAALDRVAVRGGQLDLDAIGIRGPSSTWTYLVNDDPFRNQIGLMLTGLGRTTIAVYSALFLMPLLVLWGLVDRYLRQRPGRRPPSWPEQR